MNLRNKRILVTGGSGFIGSHILENLINKRKVNPKNIFIPRSNEVDLRIFRNARKIMQGIDIVFHLAADIGGMGYSINNSARQYYNCSLLDLQVLEAARQEEVEKIVLVSSACAYSYDAKVPLKEEMLFEGRPSKAYEGYGMAKRMSVFLAEIYKREYGINAVVVVPNNTYGPGDNFDLENGYVIPSLIRRCLTEKELIVWDNGSATRDFLYVEDTTEGIILAMEKLEISNPVNLGSGKEISIRDLVNLVVKFSDFKGSVKFRRNNPKGQIKRYMDVNRSKKLMNFKVEWSIEEGIRKTIEWYKIKMLNKIFNNENKV